jgi:hypothetical protein
LDRSGVDRSQRVRDCQFAVVVAMDADGDGQRCETLDRLPRDLGDFLGQRAAVGVAQHDQSRAGLRRGLNGSRGVFGVGLPAVEEMLGVVEHLAPALDQELNRIRDHLQILVQRHAQHFGHVEIPCLAHDRTDRRAGVQQGLHAWIVGRNDAAPARHSKGAHLGVTQIHLADAAEVLDVLFVRQRVAAFDEVHTDFVQPFGDLQLVVQRQTYPLALGAVAQRRIVDLDGSHRRNPAENTKKP